MSKINSTVVKFPVHLRLKDGTAVAAKDVVVDVSGPQPVHATLNDGQEATVQFTTETVGAYQVSLKYNGNNLQYSPLTVNVAPKEKSAPEAPAPSLPELKKQSIVFEVDAKNEDGTVISEADMDLSLEVEGPEQVEPAVERQGDTLRISFDVMSLKGTYNIGVLQQGKHLQRSPFTLELTPGGEGTSAPKEAPVAKLPPLPKSREIQFRVPSDGFNASDVVGKVYKGQSEDGNVRISQDGDKLLVLFDCFHPGSYEIAVTKKSDNQGLPGSPFDIDVPQEAFGTRS
eukprot:TRINITY_DN2754_c0_g1_i4.p1 TRINITY_DN2754_c0_g1~~TRINITY_DN2754_c0_g1_i4.p1  ORF type:complete len:300 (+),score=66.79 TRINITY_DN2754_c0_g1_i4:43-900(+)